MDSTTAKRKKRQPRQAHPDAEKVLGGRLYRIEEAAQILEVHHSTIRQAIAAGELTSTIVGGSHRISADKIKAYVAERTRQAEAAAEEKRRERDRKLELARLRSIDVAAKWGEAFCVWCGVQPVLATRNQGLDGDVRCPDCRDLAEAAADRGGRPDPSKDVIERMVSLQVRELDEKAEEELDVYEQMARDLRIQARVREAEHVPMFVFEGEDPAPARERLVAAARRRPAHWLVFRCPVCGRPQPVSRRQLKDLRVQPDCAHDPPYAMSREDELGLLGPLSEVQEAELAGIPMIEVLVKARYFAPKMLLGYAELEAREWNLEEGYAPDLDEARWKVCPCAHCGDDLAVATRELRLIGLTTCRRCVSEGRPASPLNRAGVIVDWLTTERPDLTVAARACACGGRDVSVREGEQELLLTWCTERSERERVALMFAWAEKFDLPKWAVNRLGAVVHKEGELEDLPF